MGGYIEKHGAKANYLGMARISTVVPVRGEVQDDRKKRGEWKIKNQNPSTKKLEGKYCQRLNDLSMEDVLTSS